MKCATCPRRRGPCYGEQLRHLCDQPAYREHLRDADPGREERARISLAMAADLCPMGSGPCGCGAGPPRQCSHPARPPLVRRADCLGCVAATAWESGVETPG